MAWAERNNRSPAPTETAYREYGLQRKGAGIRALPFDDGGDVT